MKAVIRRGGSEVSVDFDDMYTVEEIFAILIRCIDSSEQRELLRYIFKKCLFQRKTNKDGETLLIISMELSSWWAFRFGFWSTMRNFKHVESDVMRELFVIQSCVTRDIPPPPEETRRHLRLIK